MSLKDDYKELVALLHSRNVNYLIVGAYAVACHGLPRYTGGFDLLIEQTDRNRERLVDVLAQFGFASLGISTGDLNKIDQVVQLGVEPTRIDIITGISGVSFEEAYKNRVEIEFDGFKLPVISIDDLIKNKTTSGRPQDLADVERLKKINAK